MKVLRPHHWRACPPKLQRRRAFTLVEGFVVVAVVVLVLAIGLPLGAKFKHTTSIMRCEDNLTDIVLGFRIWEGDNNDKPPMEVPVALGGAQELIATGNVTGCFQVMSNELSAPKILTCPKDSQHSYDNFGWDALAWARLSRTNLSYFIGLNATNSVLPTMLSGDANLLQNGRAVPAGKLNLWSNSVTWTQDRHHGHGNILLPDGSVQTVSRMGFSSSAGTRFATNCVVVP
jgi:competence protein ComGC